MGNMCEFFLGNVVWGCLYSCFRLWFLCATKCQG